MGLSAPYHAAMARLSDELLRHLREPAHAGEPEGGYQWRGEAANPACRDHLILYLATDGDAITRVGFRATGCPACLAMVSAACELLPGEALDGGLAERVRERFVARHGEPAALHRHALALVVEALAGARG